MIFRERTSGKSDNIFERKKEGGGPFFFLLLLLIAGALYYLFDLARQDPRNQAAENQQKALEHIGTLRGALESWKKNDYDANGKLDYPLLAFTKLVKTKFINGERLELLPTSLAVSDLRLKDPVSCDGYYFSFTSPFAEWPQEKMVSRVDIIAVPAQAGITGICSFYVSTTGEGYFSEYKQKERVPQWPGTKVRREKIWKVIPPDLLSF